MLLMLSDPDRNRSQNQNPNPKTGVFYYQKLRRISDEGKIQIFKIKICSGLQEGLFGSEKPPERTYSSSKQFHFLAYGRSLERVEGLLIRTTKTSRCCKLDSLFH
jgi:hypothetical protein